MAYLLAIFTQNTNFMQYNILLLPITVCEVI